MPEVTVRIALAALATVFGWAALAKLVRWERWSDALGRYELPAVIARPARVAVPIAEGLVAIFIVVGATTAGSVLALSLLALFTAVVMRTGVSRGDAVPCGCFGGARERSATTLLVRNFGLAALAAIALSAEGPPRLLEGVAAPRGADALPALLIVLGVGLAAWLVRHVFFGRPQP